MKIKEVEELVGLDRGNIYYYEKEGLLSPTRNKENNYREYSTEDVEVLNKIKLLRILDISTSDIKLLNEGELTLKDAAKKQLEEYITEEKENCKTHGKLCSSLGILSGIMAAVLLL